MVYSWKTTLPGGQCSADIMYGEYDGVYYDEFPGFAEKESVKKVFPHQSTLISKQELNRKMSEEMDLSQNNEGRISSDRAIHSSVETNSFHGEHSNFIFLTKPYFPETPRFVRKQRPSPVPRRRGSKRVSFAEFTT